MKVIFMFLLTYCFMASDGFALRCGNKLANQGDRKAEVLLKCGEPTLVEKWREEVVIYEEEIEKHIKKVVNLYFEEWTYNFGSNRFLYFLKFKNDELSHIETGARGYDGTTPSRKTTCGNLPAVGERKIEVLISCGVPTLKEEREEERISSIFDKKEGVHKERKLKLSVEEWTYNFGSNEFTYFLRFENGKLVNIERRILR